MGSIMILDCPEIMKQFFKLARSVYLQMEKHVLNYHLLKLLGAYYMCVSQFET